jgi:hypothetical protein
MDTPVKRFLDLFRALAADAAEGWCGDRTAVGKFFKGTSYGQRHKDWFVDDSALLPRRAMRHHDYDILRQLLARARARTGTATISGASLRELDLAYSDYISSMDRLDARRDRARTGRTLHVSAARERVERFLGRNSLSLRDLNDFDGVRVLRTALWKTHRKGDLLESIRVADAICLTIEKEYDQLLKGETPRYLCAATCAEAGQWAAAIAAERGALVRFQAVFKRFYSISPESGVQSRLWWAEAYHTKQYADASFKVLAHREKLLKTFIYRNSGPCFAYLDAAANGTIYGGIPLAAPVRQLRGQSAEGLFQQVIADCETNIGGRPDVAVSHDSALAWALFGRALAQQLHVKQAQRALDSARRHLSRIEDIARYLTLLLKVVEVDIHRAEWSLSRNPEVLISCVKKIEDAASFADEMNLTNRASALRSIQLV